MSTLLDTITCPADLKKIPRDQLPALAEEIRAFLLETVSRTGGHLASNLGVVELSIALHYCFDSPTDRFVWDVGHQAYTHKILTGRRDRFHTQRQYGGISGFPKRSESSHDAFDTGHSSTSISAGLGMAMARELRGGSNKVVAVIGDGSMTGGIAFEALNQAGHLKKNLIVVLNDNEMSISPNVGAFSSFVSRKLTGSYFRELKKEVQGLLQNIPAIGKDILQFARRAENSLKGFLTPGMLFEALGFDYIGPIQGHNLPQLLEVFENARGLDGPVVVHVMTTKGKGYVPAETNPSAFHGVGPFDVATGKTTGSKPGAASYTGIFGDTLAQLARENEKIVAITAAMPDGTGLTGFAKEFPERFFDVGIAEQHAVTFAAGLAAEGFRPVTAIYSTFLQRAYDQVFHDVCLQNLPVVFALDRGGVVGDDGPTHHGVFDLSYLRHLPGMTLMAPKDENELRHMLKTAVSHDGPIALRYPRGAGCGIPLDQELREIPIGTGEILAEGDDVAIIAIGITVLPALEAARTLAEKGIRATVINARFVKPLDREMILQAARRTGCIITAEENALQGGFGSAVLELLADEGMTGVRVKRLGIPDRFVEQGPQPQLRADLGIDAAGIAAATEAFLAAKGAPAPALSMVK
ncbi:1-deoxy-D-xylulose-5-phosphate synthase [Geobacter sulfurreducens]|jgi:1-deoxy-D-xylulose-5-phosphate synthase|uniref:1-deoxy-D-xylulose-5-phosphate synthase 1 n=1 Tax=Geobacter sulfurreducens (strain ATCC 51573 / DSM 12127 / PCA) TaxID=243231 RepID=DXS1_GEOSL|nr:1-deoxy-D-xylulose-5-phosphate synthase [Geobacter sulfurreducens]Q74FC3.1 RecName: Full=1-deoxy-D-xylulose-5-phosphate synthase 1; AltName: Full=1-deoxyxylulose-5-phosphate synthase 1; Short=DXP synthase 1; Short=DXPS 1 [Geobacter sulfurreducens PCA]AAR34016.1 1-deoxy-D-xylulose-5-phosphate synthase [Geobacter sulfurreducens PCA]ADI83523.1 1-deoxy-D-xylulose-5-phosphate synthase [Geobacter sulfurreducens KN400]AJY70433.1 1-deoxy-D-xylulose-5-phosphate synthase [Geobacter sulfurreducens]UAC